MQSRVRANYRHMYQYSTGFCSAEIGLYIIKSLNFRFVFVLLVNKYGSHINKSDIPLLSAFLDLIKQYHGTTGVI